jgi:AraC-like DNA-binding protein/mannose-6-phosphate isomerase-like protein (cupin superfamily)
MSQLRQNPILTEYDPKRGVAVATLSYEYPAGYRVPDHAHGSDQLIYAVSGLMAVTSEQSVWLIPPQFALWIPARLSHRIRMHGAVSMRTLYLRTGAARKLEQDCAVLHVSSLLRELIAETVKLEQLRISDRYERALRELLIDQITKASPVPTCITMPRERRALAIAQALLQELTEPKPLAALCSDAGVSVRTIERVFRKEVGTSFSDWRTQVRLTKAVELLVSGCLIKEAAYEVGYKQVSAFVALFRKTFGMTPKAWVAALQAGNNLPSSALIRARRQN